MLSITCSFLSNEPTYVNLSHLFQPPAGQVASLSEARTPTSRASSRSSTMTKPTLGVRLIQTTRASAGAQPESTLPAITSSGKTFTANAAQVVRSTTIKLPDPDQGIRFRHRRPVPEISSAGLSPSAHLK